MHHVIFRFKCDYVIAREKAKQIQKTNFFCCFKILDVKHSVSGQIYLNRIAKRRARGLGERSLLDSATLAEAG